MFLGNLYAQYWKHLLHLFLTQLLSSCKNRPDRIQSHICVILVKSQFFSRKLGSLASKVALYETLLLKKASQEHNFFFIMENRPDIICSIICVILVKTRFFHVNLAPSLLRSLYMKLLCQRRPLKKQHVSYLEKMARTSIWQYLCPCKNIT